MSPARQATVLVLFAAACSARSSTSGESQRLSPEPTAVVAQAGPPQEVKAPIDPREATLAAATTALLENEHLLRRKIDDELSREAFKNYVQRLDSGKMFLLRKDAAGLGRFADRIDDELHSGDLELAHEGRRIFAARLAVVEKLVAELLAQPVDLSNEELVEVDPKKIDLAETEDELRDRWRRRLELEVMERVSGMEMRLAEKNKPPGKDKDKDKDKDDDDATGAAAAGPVDQIPATPEAREAKARADLAVAYAGRFARLHTPPTLGPASDLVNAVTSALDPHTNYLPPADKANFEIAMSGSLEGIGAVLRERDHLIEVVELVPGGASWREGHLSQGDFILSVMNEGKPPVDVTDMRIDEVVKMIRGPKGTVVKLRVKKASSEEVTIAITRDVVVIEDAYARGAVLSPGKGEKAYGYIYLPSFYGGQGSHARTASVDVRHLLDEMKAKKVAGVVVDIRSNGGGLLSAAVDIAGLFIDRGPVVQIQDGAKRRDVLADRDSGTSYDGPVVVLVDRFSASASEIVAGALQDYHRAVIVGTGFTHGKGTVQSLADLDRLTGGTSQLGVLKLTIQQFFRVSGASTQREGVAPDVVLPDPVAHVEAGERSLEHAIPWSQIDPAPHVDTPHPWKPALLAARSAARVAASKVFAKIVARSQLLRTWRDDTQVPLSRQAFEARTKTRRAALEATATDLGKGPPRFAVKLLDEDATKPAPRPDGKADDRLAKWSDTLARDPWVEESLNVLGDMSTHLAAK